MDMLKMVDFIGRPADYKEGCFGQYLYTSSINMSEEQRDTPTHSHSPDYEQVIDDHPAKLKPIKKQKGEKEKEQGKLTKEERMKIQKEKNREAAQRSRDQHKGYVTSLQHEIRLLKEQVELNKKYCFKCQKELEHQDRFFDQELDNRCLSYNQHSIFLEGDPPLQEDALIAEPAEPPKEEEYFLRLNNQEEDFSYLKLMLFIAMVAIGIFLYPSGSPPADVSRSLLQVYQAPLTKPIPMDDYPLDVEMDVNDSVGIHQRSPDIFAESNRGLVVRNSVINQQCLDSLFDKQAFSLTNLRTARTSLGTEVGDGILLCSFQQQRGLAVGQGEGKSAFLRLFLMGAEIKEMVTANSPIKKFVENNLQLNGIYRVNAEVKQVELISHHNCLL